MPFSSSGYVSDSSCSDADSAFSRVDTGGVRSRLKKNWKAFRAAQKAFSTERQSSKLLSQAEIVSNLTALVDDAGVWLLSEDARWDRSGVKEARRWRTAAEREWVHESDKLYDQLLRMDERGWPGWSAEGQRFVQSAWQTEPMSLVNLARNTSPGSVNLLPRSTSSVSVKPLPTPSVVTTTTTTTPRKIRKRRRRMSLVDVPARTTSTTKSTVTQESTPSTQTTTVNETTPGGMTATATVTKTAPADSEASSKEAKA